MELIAWFSIGFLTFVRVEEVEHVSLGVVTRWVRAIYKLTAGVVVTFMVASNGINY